MEISIFDSDLTADQIHNIFLTQRLSVEDVTAILNSFELREGKNARKVLEQKLEIALLRILNFRKN